MVFNYALTCTFKYINEVICQKDINSSFLMKVIRLKNLALETLNKMEVKLNNNKHKPTLH